MSHRQPKSQTPQSTELGWWRAWTWREALPGVSDTPSLGTWGCGEHEGTPFLSGVGCLGGECSFIVQFGFHLGGRRRLCGEGSWCSSQRAGEVDKSFVAEVDERFVGEVEERGRRGGREKLAPGSRIVISGPESRI